jgi:hypothetical protein
MARAADPAQDAPDPIAAGTLVLHPRGGGGDMPATPAGTGPRPPISIRCRKTARSTR